jgi:8-oxo-dGTP pyrophosphatase MutT (NUDIX family)
VTGTGPTPTERQVSAGGVVVRRRGERVEVAIICVGDRRRWQLPKGLVEPDETPEQAAAREVREEAGVDADLLQPLETIEYWYVATRSARGAGGRSERVRYHKFVHFFLFAYRSGDVRDHDHEVHEASWVSLDEALERLAFASERRVVEQARGIIEGT